MTLFGQHPRSCFLFAGATYNEYRARGALQGEDMRFTAALGALIMAALLPLSANATSLVARVSLSAQTMTVTENGVVRYRWKVSTGRSGYTTPTGSWRAKWASRHHRSRKYDNAPMPYAIFFNGGYAVHATFDLKRLGRPASHGCVRLHPDNAAEFYQLAQRTGLGNTRILISQ
jgi:L,D-transpeptidase catalytic domain